MTTRRRMLSFSINEISAVDHPAQKGALATIIKADKAKQFATTFAKYYLDPMSGAVSFDQVMRNCLADERYWAVMKEIGGAISALETSLRSIVGDTTMVSGEKQNMMRDSVESFMAAIRQRWPDVEEALTGSDLSGMSAAIPAQTSAMKQGETEMADKELEAQVASLTKQLETATKASKDAKIAVDASKAAEELTAKLNDATAKLAEINAKLGEETTKAAMSDEEKAHLATLSGKAKMEFMTASSAERKAMMSKSAEGDETITVEGQTVSKRAVGDAQFAIIKSQAAKIAANAEEIAKERTARENAEYTKRADAELKHLPGETMLKVKALRLIEKADAEVKEVIGKMLMAGDKAISAAYGTLGGRGGDDITKNGDDAKKAFSKRVDEIQAADKTLSPAEALQKARRDYPEEFKAYQGQ